MSILDEFGEFLGNESVTVETYTGDGAEGPVFAVAEVLSEGLMVERMTKQVKNAKGDTVLSSTAIYLDPTLAPRFTTGSRVTLADGKVAYVLDRAILDVAGLPSNAVVHLE